MKRPSSMLAAVQCFPENFGEQGRIQLSSTLLKQLKCFAGDPLLVRATKSRKFVVGTAWPCLDLEDDSDSENILLPPSHYLTLGLQPGIADVTLENADTNTTNLKGKGKPAAAVDIQPASSIVCAEISSVSTSKGAHAKSVPSSSSNKNRSQDWLLLLLREVLVDLRYVVDDQLVTLEYEGQDRYFKVLPEDSNDVDQDQEAQKISTMLRKVTLSPRCEPSTNHTPAFKAKARKITWQTKVDLVDSVVDMDPNDAATSPSPTPAPDPYALIGGLTPQITQIRDLIEIPLTRPDLFAAYGLRPPRGILLHGPPGTGKTVLALTISRGLESSTSVAFASCGDGKNGGRNRNQRIVHTFHISGPELHSPYHGETESALRSLFAKAREKAPSIIILDEVDAICPRREDRGGGGEGGTEGRVVATLLGEMDGLGEGDRSDGGERRKEGDGDAQRVVVIATTNRPNAIDPALRRPGRFDREIEIGIPTADARTHILTVLLSKTPHGLTSAELEDIGSKTHGYVGADLAALVREAGMKVIKRLLHEPHSATRSAPHSAPQLPSDNALAPPTRPPQDKEFLLTYADLLSSLPQIPPSALRSLALPVLPTHWSTLGGRTIAHIRQKLTEAITWPLTHPDSFARFGVQPPRGVLLYGPPGCSKTMVGRALATESGVNFLAVRGPEILNKFVGESEKGVRELFAKARATKPCIIFFDEIDALATSRSAFSESSHNGILTSLLNEMDGVQDASGVVVVGATNRPDAIDSALLRPGRLDRLIYVAPPDYEDRIAILKVKVSSMAADPQIDLEELARLTDGCSGAELSALCRDAALITMGEDMNAPCVPHKHFLVAAQRVQRQITKEMLDRFEDWRRKSGNMDSGGT